MLDFDIDASSSKGLPDKSSKSRSKHYRRLIINLENYDQQINLSCTNVRKKPILGNNRKKST